ncbi:hypothetical protein DRJ17_05085 [Candidatus Woesearchaeota archaeon]|mgnify:CR=1 FL=1|nr:MAG: hypothetical protein DRJ17_05085 [Candidatus Woesearchaeota archaeon]
MAQGKARTGKYCDRRTDKDRAERFTCAVCLQARPPARLGDVIHGKPVCIRCLFVYHRLRSLLLDVVNEVEREVYSQIDALTAKRGGNIAQTLIERWIP